MTLNKPFLVHALMEEVSVIIEDFPLCQFRLLNDRENPAFILVPKIQAVKMLNDLNQEERFLLIDEIDLATKKIKSALKLDIYSTEITADTVHQLHVRLKVSPATTSNISFFDAKDAYGSAEKDQILNSFKLV